MITLLHGTTNQVQVLYGHCSGGQNSCGARHAQMRNVMHALFDYGELDISDVL